MATVFALVDCNNFYASCEKIFYPAIEGKSVIVLSNNDYKTSNSELRTSN